MPSSLNYHRNRENPLCRQRLLPIAASRRTESRLRYRQNIAGRRYLTWLISSQKENNNCNVVHPPQKPSPSGVFGLSAGRWPILRESGGKLRRSAQCQLRRYRYQLQALLPTEARPKCDVGETQGTSQKPKDLELTPFSEVASTVLSWILRPAGIMASWQNQLKSLALDEMEVGTQGSALGTRNVNYAVKNRSVLYIALL